MAHNQESILPQIYVLGWITSWSVFMNMYFTSNKYNYINTCIYNIYIYKLYVCTSIPTHGYILY